MITHEIIEQVLALTGRSGLRDVEIQGENEEIRKVAVRKGDVESVASSRTASLTLRLFHGRKLAEAKTNDISAGALMRFVQKTIEMLPLGNEDEANGLADKEERPKEMADLRLLDEAAYSFTLDAQVDLARRAETAAFGADPRIQNARETAAEYTRGEFFYACPDFSGSYPYSLFSLGTEVVATFREEMQVGDWFVSSRLLNQLPPPEEVGQLAARMALGRLGGKKIKTCRVPVIFGPRAASDFIGTVQRALSGQLLYRKASFLYEKLGETIASSCVTLVDDPLMPSGLGSRPFDREGVSSRKLAVIEGGKLKSYLLDSYSARKLGLKTTGGAHISNFYLRPGEHSPQQIIASLKDGLYVSDLLGFGINLLNGTYSKGVTGHWIQNGELAFPVQEIIIAGNLMEMLQGVEMVGNDLDFYWPTTSPTIKITSMMVAGN